jgi:hypothetical protein
MSRLAIITFLNPNGGGDVDNSLPGAPVYPGNALPGYGRPDNSLPGLPPQAIQLPVLPFDPTVPDNSLPDVPVVWPPRPGNKFVIKWLACHGLVLVPDNSLPVPIEPEPK